MLQFWPATNVTFETVSHRIVLVTNFVVAIKPWPAKIDLTPSISQPLLHYFEINAKGRLASYKTPTNNNSLLLVSRFELD